MALRKWLYRHVYLKLKYWHWIHNLVGKKAGWKCEVKGCSVNGHNLNAHHKAYHLFMEWLNLRDLVYLCPHHHAQTHSGWRLQLTHNGHLEPFYYRGKVL